MEVLRENRDSLVATLEAFVHDPLISWRLLNTKKYVLLATISCCFSTVACSALSTLFAMSCSSYTFLQ